MSIAIVLYLENQKFRIFSYLTSHSLFKENQYDSYLLPFEFLKWINCVGFWASWVSWSTGLEKPVYVGFGNNAIYIRTHTLCM